MKNNEYEKIDLSMWSPELQAKIRNNLKMGEEFLNYTKNIKGDKKMSWIILEVDSDDYEVNDVKIMTKSSNETAIFKTREEADNWLEDNNEKGLSYHVVEVW